MTRAEAYEALHTYVTNPNLIKHHLACEAIMISLCKRFYTNADEVLLNKWGIVGLLHDADYELTRGNPAEHHAHRGNHRFPGCNGGAVVGG